MATTSVDTILSFNAGASIAIDGPAASGKSSVARALAGRLGYGYVNSGAFYRAVTWFVLEQGVDPHDGPAVAALLDKAQVSCWLRDGRFSHRV